MLPLQLCPALVGVGAYGLATLNPLFYEFMYFMGIAGPLQAVLTPDAAHYGLPHVRALQTLESRGTWTLGKPPVVSLLDVLGPWPWYLIPVVLLGILNVLLLYAPFWWTDHRRARADGTRDPPPA